MSVVLEIPVKQKTKEIGEGSGNIWDRCACPSTLNSIQIREIESTWSLIPKKYTDDLNAVHITQIKSRGCGGLYNITTQEVELRVGGVGASGTLLHEVHHHMWYTKRTPDQISKWKAGVDKIMEKHGLSPTKYSDSYGYVTGVEKLKELNAKIEEYQNAVETNNIQMEFCFSDYADAKKIISADDIRRAKNNKEPSAAMISMQERTMRAEESFKSKTNEEKRDMIFEKLDIMEEKRQEAEYTATRKEIFYNESHSETGAFVFAEESERAVSNLYDPKNPKWDARINDDVIDKYVDLYLEVFG